MKVQVIYSSLSGRTKKLAEALYHAADTEEKSIHNLKDGVPELDGDVILLGYWVDKGGPNAEMKALLGQLKGKTLGLFCTLGFYADAKHGWDSIQNGVELVKENNTILGTYVCNGALSQEIIDSFRKAGTSGHHSASPENEIRWEIMKNHPTEAEINLAVERFNERIEILRQYQEQGLTFKSIL